MDRVSRLMQASQYQALVGLQDIRTIAHLNREAIRDILRAKTGDQQLELDSLGELEDMSGTNDAFNSSICSMEVTAKMEKADDAKKTFYFVIKSPPKSSFIKMTHKITRPFLNEVTWYLVSSPHLTPVLIPRQDLLVQMALLESSQTVPGPPLHSRS